MIYKRAKLSNPKKAIGQNEGGNVYTFAITAEYADRMNEVILIDGIKIDNYMQNNVVLWNHDNDRPAIGTMDNIRRDGNKKIGDVTVYDEDIQKRVESGVIKSGSVGFIPLSRPVTRQKDKELWERYKVPEDVNQITVYERTELVEFSLTNVPANQYALLQKRLADVIKSGRVLSAANVKKINNIVTQLSEASEALKEILSAAGYEEPSGSKALETKEYIEAFKNECEQIQKEELLYALEKGTITERQKNELMQYIEGN